MVCLRRTAFLALCLLLTLPAAAPASQVELISRAEPSLTADSGGAQSLTGQFPFRTVSADGRFSVFTSDAGNLVPGQVDGNGGSDVFLYDRTAGTLTLVSHAASGSAVAGNRASSQPAISADGSRVAYLSEAIDLIAGQSEGGALNDVVLWDRATGTNTLVSHAAASAATTANRDSLGPLALSADGTAVVYCSYASDLVSGQVGPAGTVSNVYLFDRGTGASTLVTHQSGAAATAADGPSEWPSLSANGRYVSYDSFAVDLIAGYNGSAGVNSNVYLWDRATGVSTLASHTAGQPAHGGGVSQFASLSADGRWMVYQSSAADLVAGATDTNNTLDIFVYDRDSGTNQLVSHPAGSPATAPARGSNSPAISADGAWIDYLSFADDLVAGQTGTTATDLGLFLTERATGNTVLVSHDSSGAATMAHGVHTTAVLSSDGRWLAFHSSSATLAAGDTNATTDVFLYDRITGVNTLVSHHGAASGNGASLSAALSADGSIVLFTTNATDLGGTALDTNGTYDAFLYDRAADAHTLVSRRDASLPSATPGGASTISSLPQQAVSPDGRWVAFSSSAPNLVPGQVDTNGTDDVFLRDRTSGTTILVSHSAASSATAANGSSQLSTVSDDGRWVAYTSTATDLAAGQADTNNKDDVFLFDRLSGTAVLVSHSTAGAATAGNGSSSSPQMSGDGSRVVFDSFASNLIAGGTDANARFDIFLFERATGALTLVSHASGSPLTVANFESFAPGIFRDGSGVLFLSLATNLVTGQTETNGTTDLFLFDPATGDTTLVSHAAGSPATAANGATSGFAATPDGHWIAYSSLATNLAAGVADPGSSPSPDVYLYDRTADTSSLVSHAAGNPSLAVDFYSGEPSLSDDGQWIAFSSLSHQLVAGEADSSSLGNIYLQKRTSGETVLVTHAPGSPTTPGCCGGGAHFPRLSADGSTLAYYSDFGNIVSGLILRAASVFVYDRATGGNALASRSLASPVVSGNGSSSPLDLSSDGSAVVFTSNAPDLVAGDFNGRRDVFVYRNGQVGSYYTLPPCRLLDTRDPADGPAILSGQPVPLTLHGACGIPETAKSVALNVTVVQPTGPGFLALYPTDGTNPGTSTLNFSAGQTRANNAVLHLALNGTGAVTAEPYVSGNGSVHLILDVVGYFE